MNKVSISKKSTPKIAPWPGRVYRFAGFGDTCFLYVRKFGTLNGGFFVNLITGLQCNPEGVFTIVEEITGAVTIEPE